MNCRVECEYFTKLSYKIYYKLDMLANTFFTSEFQFSIFLSFDFVSLFTLQMAQKINYVYDISPSKENWNIMVRVIQLWFVRDMNKDKLSIENISKIIQLF